MRFFLVLLTLIPGFAFAAGGDGTGGTTWTNPPKPTETTETCTGIQVWDTKTKKCVNPQGTSLDPDTLIGAVRELAYAGRNKDAQGVLQVIANQNDDLVLTYWGFTHRKLGKTDLAQAFYTRAITQNPDNILARSYMGQGFVEQGRIEEAIAQWREIKARGGQDSWAEASLREAIRTGITYNY